jgi:hypothetical protein
MHVLDRTLGERMPTAARLAIIVCCGGVLFWYFARGWKNRLDLVKVAVAVFLFDVVAGPHSAVAAALEQP